MDDLSEYLELYVQTSKEYIQSLNAALLVLEKNPTDAHAIEEIFRNAHSLKSQSAAMGYQSTGYLCHVVEDIFYEIKQGRKELTSEIADHLFAAFDALTRSIARIEKESTEEDSSATIETLKQLSGVTTEGAGKSQHNADGTATKNPSQESAVPPPAETHAQSATPTSTAAVAAPESTRSAVNTISVKVEVLDEMMNLLENLLVERIKLKRVSATVTDDNADLESYFNASAKILASLQYQIMKARAVPVGLVFDHFPRAVRDLARTENKQIELVITGSDLELDRTIVDRLDEPLIHLLRNAVSHGIKEKGVITLSAARQKDYAQITVRDDGQGVDWQLVAQKAGLDPGETDGKLLKDALFSGISTSVAVTQISGRGVGLTAIKKMVDSFGGVINVESKTGQGTAFIIKLPLTLAIAKALVVTIDQKQFVIPTLAVERIINIPTTAVKKLAGQETFVIDDQDIPLIKLNTKLLGSDPTPVAPGVPQAKNILAVVLGEGSEKIGLSVDAVLESADIIIKPVPDVLKTIRGFSGVTILDDGKTALIINPQELL